MAKNMGFPIYELRVAGKSVAFRCMEDMRPLREELEMFALAMLDEMGERGEFTTPEALEAARAAIWPEVLWQGTLSP
jgi:hypothetical protein